MGLEDGRADSRLQNQAALSAPDQIWVADITYIPTAEGWLYVAGVLDRRSRRVLGPARYLTARSRAAAGPDPARSPEGSPTTAAAKGAEGKSGGRWKGEPASNTPRPAIARSSSSIGA